MSKVTVQYYYFRTTMYVYGRRIFLHLESFGFRLIMRSRKVPLLVKRGRGG